MEGGFLNHNPAWRTCKYSGKKKEKLVADEETVQKIITALEMESLLKEYDRECVWQADAYENRELTADDFVFRFDKNKKAASEALQRGLDI